MIDPQTVIFYGRSGSGKGTQAVLLKKFIEERDEENEVIYFETGKALRELAEKDTTPGKLTKEVMDTGGLLPSLIVMWVWGGFFMNNFEEDKHVILDGVARRKEEAPLVNDALKFLKRKNTTVVIIDTSREWCVEKLLDRGRYDDTKENIERRLDWYEENSFPAIEHFEKDSENTVLRINGEQPIADVHNDLLEALKIK